MRGGHKLMSVDEKRDRGTLRPCRENGVSVVVEPNALPQQPDWLTEEGGAVWLDNIGRVSTARGASELDTEMFANFCNLQGAVIRAWRAGEVPPITAMMETRKMMELLRIGGTASRLVKVADGEKPSGNPFIKQRPKG